MKIILLILFFYLTAFASDFDVTYKNLNSEIDKISKKLTLEEKISLYYLSLSTHDQIFTLLYKKEQVSKHLQETKKKMLLTIANLTNNNNITAKEIIKLRNLYATMNHTARNKLQTAKQKKPQSLKIIYKEVDKKPYVKTVLFAFSILFMFISSILAYLLYQSKNTYVSKEDFLNINEKEKEVHESPQAKHDLDSKLFIENKNLKNKIKSLKSNYTNLLHTLEMKLEETSNKRDSFKLQVQELNSALAKSKASDSLTISTKDLTHIQEQSENIFKTVKIFSEIAEQTNSLAISATMEAARADEHGREFALIAGKVRELAEKTQKTLKDAKTEILTIVHGINKLGT